MKRSCGATPRSSPRSSPCCEWLKVLFTLVSRTISRVMSRMIIYLGVSSPKPSSNLPESEPGRLLLSAWSCSGWGLHSPPRYRDGGSLLHCHSILPYGARTFLVCTLSSVQPRSFVLLTFTYFCYLSIIQKNFHSYNHFLDFADNRKERLKMNLSSANFISLFSSLRPLSPSFSAPSDNHDHDARRGCY